MTTERNIIIHQGQAFELSLNYAGALGRSQRMHIRLADQTATIVQALSHNGAANARVIYNDSTQQLDITIGATVSAAWVVLADRVEWTYDIEDYDPADEDDTVIPYRGKVIVRGNRTRPEDATLSPQMPNGDSRYTRFDGEQNLTPEQMAQAQINILGEEYAPGGSGDVVGPASATDDRIAAFDGVTGKLIKQGGVTATAVASHLSSTSNPHSVTAAQVGADPTGTAAAAVVAHTGAFDPHGDRAYADAGLALKAPIASPTFTGVPAAPTASGGTNTTQVATTAFVTSAVASAVAGLLEFIGNVDASTNPNYSAASKGDSYLISVAGKIGGASGKSVEVGDLVVASADNAGGSEASVGTSWFVLEHNLAGALLTANALSELSGVAGTARSNLGLTALATTTPGTGIATALAVAVGSAGAPVINGGALGTPSSGNLANCTFPAISGLTGFTAAENTSSPNATVPVASLTANNAATNVDAALRPKGTGAVLAHVPDSTATGGNKRGANSVDWQTSRATAAQVASGLNSVVGGGERNTASSDYTTVAGGYANIASSGFSTVAGGSSNTANAYQSTVGGGAGNVASGAQSTVAGGTGNTTSGVYSWCPGGSNASTRSLYGGYAYASTFRSVAADNQHIGQITGRTTTDATTTTLTADRGAVSSTNVMVLPNNSSLSGIVVGTARDSSGNCATWIRAFRVTRGANAASTAVAWDVDMVTPSKDAALSAATFVVAANTTQGAAVFNFTGIAATTIDVIAEPFSLQIVR